MNSDLMLRDAFNREERRRQKSIAQDIQDGVICPYCFNELDEMRPCLECKAKEHLRALLTDAFSMFGINADIAAAIIHHGNEPRDKAFFRHTRKAAATVLRDARRRYR